MSSLRGGFRSVAHGVTGQGKSRPQSPARRWIGNIITIALLVAAGVLLGRRLGLFK